MDRGEFFGRVSERENGVTTVHLLQLLRGGGGVAVTEAKGDLQGAFEAVTEWRTHREKVAKTVKKVMSDTSPSFAFSRLY